MKTKLILLLVLLIAGCSDMQFHEVDFEHLVRSTRPNNYLVCAEGFCQGSDQQAREYSVNRQTLEQRWLQLMEKMPRTSLLYHYPESHQYHFVQRTKWMRFPDDIYVQFYDLGESRSTLSIYSVARYGYYDFEVNQKRVLSLLKALNQTFI